MTARPSTQPTLFPVEDDPPAAPIASAAPALAPGEKPVRVRGFACPTCRGVRLFVYRTRRPMAGRVVRYRKCSWCGYRTTTEERLGHSLPTKSVTAVQ